MCDPLHFECSQCGECCRHIDQIPQLKAFDTGEGVCMYLQGDRCEIYEARPEICRVDVMYEKYFISACTRKEFYQMNAAGCKVLLEAKN